MVHSDDKRERMLSSIRQFTMRFVAGAMGEYKDPVNVQDKELSRLIPECGKREKAAALRTVTLSWNRMDGSVDHSGQAGALGRALRKLFKICIVTVALIWLGAWGSVAQALTCTSNAGAVNWGTVATWSCGRVPIDGDSVIIPNGSTVTLNVDTNTLAGLQIDSGGTITILAGSTRDIYLGGNLVNVSLVNNGTINLSLSTSANVIYLEGANVTATFSGSGTWLLDRIDLNGTGPRPCTGTCKVELSGSPNLQFYNATPFSGNSATDTFNAVGNSTATVTLAFAGNQAIATTGITYPNLVLTGSGAKNPAAGALNVLANLTLSGTATSTTAGNLSVGGNLNVGSGTTLTVAGFNIAVTGTTSVSGTMTHSSATGTKTYTGDVTINSGGTWNETAAAAISFGGDLQNDGTLTASTGVHTFTGAAKTLSGANAIAIPSVTVSDTYQNNGTLTVATALAGAGTLTNGNGTTGTLNIGASAANLTLTTLIANAANNTVNYNLAGAQTVKATAYHDLTLSTSGVKTMTGVTTIGGNLTISGTATMTGNAAFTVAGAFNYASTGTTTLTAATPISIGTFNQTAGTLVDNGNTITVTGTGAGTWTRAGGAFTATGTVIFTGAAPQIGASNFNNLTINVGAGNTATLTGNATPAGNLSVSTGTLDLATFTANRTAAGGTIVVANGATLRIGGTNTFPTNYTTHTLGVTSTVEYNGTNQSVAAEAAPGYGNLTLSGSGTKAMPAAAQAVRGNFTMSGTASATAGGALTVGGDFILGSGTTFNAGTFSHSVAGDFTNNGGTFTASTSTITLNGSAVQVIGGTTATGFNNLAINNAGGVTLGNSPTVSGVLTLTSGIVTTGANVLEVVSSCATGIVRTGGFVLGNLSLHYPTNAGTTTCTFPIGDPMGYTPVTVAMANVTSTLANSIITARTDPGDHPDTVALIAGIDPGKSVNRTWTLTPGGTLSFATYNATFSFLSSDIDPGANTSNFIIGRKSGGVWTYPTLGAKNPNDTTATGITQVSGFGVFAIGERALPSITTVKAVQTFSDPYNNTTNPKVIPGSVMLYTVTVLNSGTGSTDAGTIVITDPIPPSTSMCVSTLCSNPPVTFICSATPACGLTYTYATAMTYTNQPGGVGPYNYTPSPDASGYDASVTGFQVKPSGAFNGSGAQFIIQFRVRVK